MIWDQVEVAGGRQNLAAHLGRGGSFGFLGFDFRRVRSLRRVWRAHYTPKLKKRTALRGSSRICFVATNRNRLVGL